MKIIITKKIPIHVHLSQKKGKTTTTTHTKQNNIKNTKQQKEQKKRTTKKPTVSWFNAQKKKKEEEQTTTLTPKLKTLNPNHAHTHTHTQTQIRIENWKQPTNQKVGHHTHWPLLTGMRCQRHQTEKKKKTARCTKTSKEHYDTKQCLKKTKFKIEYIKK